jgi:hypothetical protein
VAATCPRCGIWISGAELLALSRPPAAETGSAKIGRLRLGDCARSGCEAYHYLVTVKPHGQVDWPFLLTQAEAILREDEQPPGDSPTRYQALRQLVPKLWRSSNTRRLWAALGVALLLILARQWYRGGTIPLIRQPRHFQIGPPLPSEVQHPHG